MVARAGGRRGAGYLPAPFGKPETIKIVSA
jgi:hypothetical protein